MGWVIVLILCSILIGAGAGEFSQPSPDDRYKLVAGTCIALGVSGILFIITQLI